MRDMRILIGLGVAAALVVLFFVFRPGGGDDDGQAAPTTTTAERTVTESNGATTTEAVTTTAPKAVQVVVRVRGGKPVDGIVRAQATKGDSVVVIVGSDVSDEVHIHGYDLKGDVAPGMPVRIRFDANLTGRFEIELENRSEQIAQLTVLP